MSYQISRFHVKLKKKILKISCAASPIGIKFLKVHTLWNFEDLQRAGNTSNSSMGIPTDRHIIDGISKLC